MSEPITEAVELKGVREYAEGRPVTISRAPVFIKSINTMYDRVERSGRWCIEAENEGGHNGTSVDLFDLLAWIKAHKPELLTFTDAESLDIARKNL